MFVPAGPPVILILHMGILGFRFGCLPVVFRLGLYRLSHWGNSNGLGLALLLVADCGRPILGVLGVPSVWDGDFFPICTWRCNIGILPYEEPARFQWDDFAFRRKARCREGLEGQRQQRSEAEEMVEGHEGNWASAISFHRAHEIKPGVFLRKKTLHRWAEQPSREGARCIILARC